jgi:ATP-dependent Clp protease ATP-binding subunit ClpA
VTQDDAFSDVQAKVRSEIALYFKTILNRPEILNRIGDNIVVFDFIRPEIAEQIFEQMVDDILADIAVTPGIAITMDRESRERLRQLCLADLSNGGRGIRNKVETNLLNPLARAIFDAGARPGGRFEIRGLQQGATTMLTLAAVAAPGEAA